MTSKKITIGVTIQAPIGQVWKSWTSPEHIINWNYATPEWCCPSATNDFQPGGTFSYRMESRDGSMGFDFSGRYERIVQNEFISYRTEDDRTVEITFLIQENGVELKETFETEDIHTAEQQRDGWQAILDNFKSYTESQTG